MTGFARQHDYRLGRALLVATVLVVVGSWLFPVQWLRFFGRPVESPEMAQLVGEPWIRLIPAESIESATPAGPRKFVPVPVQSPDLADPAAPERHEWTFDPTTAWSPLTGSTEPLAGTRPDSVQLRADLLNSLRLANWGAVFAMLDTTQTGRAHEQLAETDHWVNRYYGPVWTAQGFGRRQSNLWYRVVGEVEAEGSH